ncbi:replication protein RepA [Salmonella enterica subsp. enterica serovar Kentucky]|uniref:Replication protein RepA n=1 Tax=Erwinia tracheiphila TaxID=65700 RepID=A0A345D087_9GAMM|nr:MULTISPECIES: replication protein RepA [Erwiniaceae]AXF79077.1 replication protein RepA [Erwinia tracheiphila]AXF79104.1 replication protein RepA [Erwinia tracheiphila]EDJ7683721.1 replication protein RepA [Salmonella enterica subsp. enterica serovar Kentucky]KAB0546098.1 replication protein RepA [Pantoea stewartii subsp. stewartii]
MTPINLLARQSDEIIGVFVFQALVNPPSNLFPATLRRGPPKFLNSGQQFSTDSFCAQER